MRLFISFFILCVTSFSYAQELPWLDAIEYTGKISDIHTLYAEAKVSVSDGLTYSTQSLYHDPQRAVFKIIYSDRIVTNGVEGKYYWSYDGTEEKEGSDMTNNIVMGHQFYAQLLFFNNIHDSTVIYDNSRFINQKCSSITGGEDGKYVIYFKPGGYPLGMVIRSEFGIITIIYKRWKKIADMNLPTQIQINDGSRVFDYEFTSVKVNEGSLDDFRAPENVLTDEQKLLRQHRKIMDAHWFGDINLMAGTKADSMVMVNQGEVMKMTGDASEEMLSSIFKRNHYSIYDDMIRPIVSISEDGSLAWVIVQVDARGTRHDPEGNLIGPLHFVSGWIELYQKINGDWKIVGNVSNFRSE